VAASATASDDHKGFERTRVMILGMSLARFTTLHVVISLIGIASGALVLIGMLVGTHQAVLTAIFLATTVLTSVTGFFFPFTKLLPSHVVGIISLVVLAAALLALYVFDLAGAWRWIYVVSAVLALYLNVFVGIVQGFQKRSFLRRLAPRQSEPPFVVAQVAVLVAFVALGVVALRSF
jgi:hypothetical protein